MTDVMVSSHFGLFFALLPPNSPKNQNFEKLTKTPGDIIILHMCTQNYDHMMYGFFRYGAWWMSLFLFWAIFCPFTLLTAREIKILKKMKKMPPGDIIILHMCTKNYCQMVYDFWDMVCDRCNYFYFALLPIEAGAPPNNTRNQNFEKMKKVPGDVIVLHIYTKNYDQMMYSSWDIVRDRCNCYFSFWAVFCPFTA